jgi:predicted nucleic acid-binding protein
MRARRVLDTSRLISFWSRKTARDGRPDQSTARAWAAELVDLEGTDAIVTPVRIEFICHANSRDLLQLYEAFVDGFAVVDRGQIGPSDWENAARLARRVPRNGKPRQLGDCLIRAVATRLGYDVMTNEIDFPR